MTKKEDLQQELKEKVKAGVKPSDLKKLKRSKSLGDIPSPPPLPDPPPNLLSDQLKEKQQEVESLRKQLEEISQELKATKQELDNSLAARYNSLKVFDKEHNKRIKAEKELNETVEEASDEIIGADNKVSDLRRKLRASQQEVNQLKQELKREKLKKGTNLNNSPELPESINYLRYTFYSLLTL